MKRILPVLLLALPGCAALQPSGTVIAQPSDDWRLVATEDDRERLRGWRSTFVSALDQARKAGHAADIAGEGALLTPDAALPNGAIPDGMYRCRVVKLGARSEGLLDYIAYPYFSCRIQADGRLQSFAKLTGSQRHTGMIFPGDALRQVFLGTLVLGDEERALQYGIDRERNVAGWIERVGPERWRMVMPEPHFESRLDVMELVPANEGAR